MDQNQKIAEQKHTDRWKDRILSNKIHQKNRQSVGAQRLIQAMKLEWCERFVAGSALLVASMDTSQMVLPLQKKGYHLTVLETALTDLQESAALTEANAIQRLEGELTALAASDASYDAVLGLGGVAHVADPLAALHEARRVLRPGGRLLFDMGSRDHFQANSQNTSSSSPIQEPVSWLLCPEELCAMANDMGMTLLGIVPVNSLLGNAYSSPAFSVPLQQTDFWYQQLSWLATDSHLWNLAWFLEQSWFACLGSQATAQSIVVLEKNENPEANQTWLQQNASLNAYLSGGELSLETLAPWLNQDPAIWRSTFDSHLARQRNQTFAFFLLTGFLGRLDGIDWRDWAPENGTVLQNLADGLRADEQLHRLTAHWHHDKAIQNAAQVDGVDLAAIMQPSLYSHFVRKVQGGQPV